MVEVEAEVQLIYKETARALARLEVRQQRSRHRRSCEGGGARAVRGVKIPCKMEGHYHNGR